MYTSVVWPALGITFTSSYSLCTTSLVVLTAFLKENEIVEATKMKKSLWNCESPSGWRPPQKLCVQGHHSHR